MVATIHVPPCSKARSLQQTLSRLRRPGYGALKGKLARLNKTPIRETAFTDRPGEALRSVSESRWAPLNVYVIRALSVLGVEGGPSPATLPIAAPPGPVLAAGMEDGRTMILSGRSASRPVRGYHLFRMDTYKGTFIFRDLGAPHPRSVFVDERRWPRGDRRAYFVIPVDGLGQLGIPSSPAWGDQMP